MLETRMPPVSTRPPAARERPAARPSPRTAAGRVALAPAPAARAAGRRPERVPVSPRAAAARAGRARLARSEARLLTVAVIGTALLCAVLVVYLAAYARVSQLGVDQALARAQLRRVKMENDQLRTRIASLQSPSRVAAAAQAQGMTAGARRVTYITPPIPQGDGARNVQVATGGTAADDTATDGH